MTTLTPAYLSNTAGYVNGEIGPGYSQNATTNQLIITGTNLPVQSNSFAILPVPITGDFTATAIVAYGQYVDRVGHDWWDADANI
jgi:hypothetical protein